MCIRDRYINSKEKKDDKTPTKIRRHSVSGSDTEIGQVGSSVPWILLKAIVFDSVVSTRAEPP